MNGRESVHILFVDDDPDLADVAAQFLEIEEERFEVETAMNAEDAEARLEDGPVDCIVSDYDMPGRNGVEFLHDVREKTPDLPFILYTGKGSEEVASEAISAGVTDYLQKEAGTGQYAVLANRIENAVEARRSARNLERHSTYTDALLDALDDVFYVIGSDGSFVRWNESLPEVSGYSDAEIERMNARDFFVEEDIPVIETSMERGFEEGSAQQEVSIVTKHGESIPYEFAAVRVTAPNGEQQLVGVGRDISERVAHEAALERERDRLNALFRNLPSPVIHGEIRDGDAFIREVNPAFEEVFGFEADEVRGARLYDLILPDDQSSDELTAEVARQLRETGEVHTDVRRKTADGELRDFQLDITLGSSDAETMEGYAMYTDVTDRKERERALERQNERLDEFASVLSHDLRTPLNLAVTRLELGRQECDNDEFRAVAKAHDRMKHLIEDVLTLAREGASVSSTESVDLDALVTSLETNFKRVDATLVTATDQTILADRQRLRRMLENMLRNAVEHGGEGVTVRLGDLPDGFFVEDDGPGIPEEIRERIFETGFSTSATGTGFGLSIAREIAEAHGWSIRVTESETGGARFEITGVTPA